MSRKRLLTISLLFPLMTVSAVAQAGTTISDKRYWPNETHPSPQPREASDALNAVIVPKFTVPHSAPTTNASGNGSQLGRYHGGPKSR